MDKRTIALVGQQGAGKSFLLNMLLKVHEGVSQPLTAAADGETTLKLDALNNQANLKGSDTWIVTDDKDASFYADEIKKEQEIEEFFRGDADQFYDGRVAEFPPFILPTAANRSYTSTTVYKTEIVGGDRYGLEITYLTKDEITELLLSYNFELGALLAREGTDNHATSYKKMVEWMKRLVQPTKRRIKAEKRARIAEKKELEDMGITEPLTGEAGEYIPLSGILSSEAYHRAFREQVTFEPFVDELSGKKLVFRGTTGDATLDRMFVRRALYGVVMQGLAHPFGHAQNTLKYTMKEVDEPSPDTYMIKSVRVIVPTSDIVGPNKVWMDLPGISDNDPIKTEQLNQGLQECDSVVMLFNNIGSADMHDVLRNKLMPRTIKELTHRPLEHVLCVMVNKLADKGFYEPDEKTQRLFVKQTCDFPMLYIPNPMPDSLDMHLPERSPRREIAVPYATDSKFREWVHDMVRKKHYRYVLRDSGHEAYSLSYYRSYVRGEESKLQAFVKLLEIARAPVTPRVAEQIPEDLEAYKSRVRKEIKEISFEKEDWIQVLSTATDPDGRVVRAFTNWSAVRHLTGGVPIDGQVIKKHLMSRLIFDGLNVQNRDVKQEVKRVLKVMNEFCDTFDFTTVC